MRHVKIVTWNIGSLPEKQENEHSFLTTVSELKADILCLQEFPDDEELVRKICCMGNYTYHETIITSPSHVGEKHNMGIAVFCKEKPEAIYEHKLIKPYESLVNFLGKQENLHNKSFMAIVFHGFVIITGHGFPCIRYCAPQHHYYHEMLEQWEKYCITGTDYKLSFDDLDDWIISIRKQYSDYTIVIAADFNIDRQLDFMPKSSEFFYDVFEGQATRPLLYYNLRDYKTDAILCPRDLVIVDSRNMPTIFDHHLLSLSFEVS